MLTGEDGFTITELLVALTLTGLLALGVGSFVSSASANLNNSVESSVTAQMALKTAKTMRFDFAGSSAVYVFGPTSPADKVKVAYQLCSSDATATFAGWGTNTAWAAIVNRLLFTVEIVEMTEVPGAVWYQQRRQLVGYELRKNIKDGNFELWRNVCTGNLLTYGMELDSAKTQRLVILGKSVLPSVAGNTQLLCTNASTTTGCSVFDPSSSSSTRPYYYSFLFPYSDTGRLAVLKNLVDPLVGRLAPKVEPYK